MIGLRFRARAAGRSGRIGLLLGLVVIVAAHLTGTVHGSPFEGSPVSAVVTVGAQHRADGGPLAPAPWHEPKAEGHADHTADRPRTVSVGDTVLGPGLDPGFDELALVPADAPVPVGARGAQEVPPGLKGPSPYGRSALVMHGVRRQ